MTARRPVADSLLLDEVCSPIGRVMVVVWGDALVALDFSDCSARMHQLLEQRLGAVPIRPCRNPGGFSDRVRQYFAGDLYALHSVPLALHGTAFQEQAWRALQAVPPGATATYAQQAARLGNPQAARAVGRANALNPLAIAIPCHRLVGAGGSLTGYAGGLHRKRWLLRHEGVDIAPA